MRRLLGSALVAAAIAAAMPSLWTWVRRLDIVALAVAGVVLVGLGFWKIPRWQAEAARRHNPSKSAFELENEARKTLAEALGGLFLVVGLAVTWVQLDQNRAEQRETAALTREGQITGRFTAAVGQLGDERLRVRLGGIYALERIARDSPDDATAVLEVLTAFVREVAPWPQPGTPTPDPDARDSRLAPPADVQAVLTVIERERWRADRAGPILLELGCLDLSGSDLRGARFRGTAGGRICLADANLTGADLGNAFLAGADLTGADLAGANLRQADLRGAALWRANLRGTFLTHADLAGADLRFAYLRGTVLQDADLRGARLTGAVLTGADLTGADLRDTFEVTRSQIDDAIVDPTTQLPETAMAPPIGSPPP